MATYFINPEKTNVLRVCMFEFDPSGNSVYPDIEADLLNVSKLEPVEVLIAENQKTGRRHKLSYVTAYIFEFDGLFDRLNDYVNSDGDFLPEPDDILDFLYEKTTENVAWADEVILLRVVDDE